MKKIILLLGCLTLSQWSAAATTFICNVEEPAGKTHVLEVKPLQTIKLKISSLNMRLELTGSASDDADLDLPSAEGFDLDTNQGEGGLIFQPTVISNGKGEAVSITCVAK